MEKQLEYTTFSPEVREVLSGVRRLVQHTLRDGSVPADERAARLKNDLESRLVDVNTLREAIINDMHISDAILQSLGDMLAAKYIRSPAVRTYELTSECPSCAKPENNGSHWENRQEVPVMQHINELDLRKGDVLEMLVEHGFRPDCPDCGRRMEITSARNIIYPAKPEATYFISTRVKSVGRYCHKLVDLIFYDEADPRWAKRSITDKYAFAIVLNYDKTTDACLFKKQIKGQIGMEIPPDCNDRDSRSFFKFKLDMDLPRMCSFDDLACYSMLRALKRDFPKCVSKVQDSLKEPKERKGPSGNIELYKMLQFDFNIHGKRFECQIKTKDTHERELSRDSATCHFTYRMIENSLRQDQYMKMPEAGAVYNFLFNIFHKEPFKVH